MPSTSVKQNYDVEQVWIPQLANEHHHVRRQRSIRRQLSRGLSTHAKRLRESTGATCNTTACAISVCFTLSILALGLSALNFYCTTTGHGPFKVHRDDAGAGTTSHNSPGEDPNSSSRHGSTSTSRTSVDPADQNDSAPPRIDGGCEAYAHILGKGDGPKSNDDQLQRLVVWQENVTHNVDFRSGSGIIRITKPGFYYVYSQIYFKDSGSEAAETDPQTGQNLPMFFATRRNTSPLLQSVIPFDEFSTKYHGGIFHLNKGDEIEVYVSNSNLRIGTSGENTYFGVFMLRPSLSHTDNEDAK